MLPAFAAAQWLSITVDALGSTGLALSGITVSVTADAPAKLDLHIDSIAVHGEQWRNLHAQCTRFTLSTKTVACRAGVLDIGEAIPLEFEYDIEHRRLDATLEPAKGERWRIQARFDAPAPVAELDVINGKLAWFTPWLPESLPHFTAGTVSGRISLQSDESAQARLAFDGLAFGDASGMHAAEKVGFIVKASAKPARTGWDWTAQVIWRSGEVYWQPVYLKANEQVLDLSGNLSDARVIAHRVRLTAPGIGVAEGHDLVWERSARQLRSGSLDVKNLPLAQLYSQWLKPALAGTAFADLRAAGTLSASVGVRDGVLDTLDLQFDGVSVDDPQRRFGLFGLTGRIPWRRGETTTGSIALDGGEVVSLPFGATRLNVSFDGTRVVFAPVSIPFLGGAASMEGLVVTHEENGWRWSVGGELTHLSVGLLTQGFGLPSMGGTISGVIPRMTYDGSKISVGGEFEFLVFDGTVTVRHLVVTDPLGYAPRLAADIDMRNIDLDLLTRTFSFGSMTGRIDAAVAGLELVDWSPVRFDATIRSSPGDYRRTISQRAVQNISALGGGGGASGIEAAILGVFENFGYGKIGLTCKLRNGVCAMSGIAPAEQGRGYVIVQGGGIPALTVIGYNREVRWAVLVDRLARIMQENVHPVIK